MLELISLVTERVALTLTLGFTGHVNFWDVGEYLRKSAHEPSGLEQDEILRVPSVMPLVYTSRTPVWFELPDINL